MVRVRDAVTCVPSRRQRRAVCCKWWPPLQPCMVSQRAQGCVAQHCAFRGGCLASAATVCRRIARLKRRTTRHLCPASKAREHSQPAVQKRRLGRLALQNLSCIARHVLRTAPPHALLRHASPRIDHSHCSSARSGTAARRHDGACIALSPSRRPEISYLAAADAYRKFFASAPRRPGTARARRSAVEPRRRRRRGGHRSVRCRLRRRSH